MKLTPRDRRAFVLGAAGLAAIALVSYVVLPMAERWQLARAQIEDGRARRTRLQSDLGVLLRQRERLVEAYGPAAGRPLEGAEQTRIAFLKAVQDLLRNAGLQEPNLQPQAPRTVSELPGVQMLSVQAGGKCQLPQLAKCLAELRKADRLIVVDRLTATANPKQPGQLEVTLVLATLARQEKSGL